MEEQGGQREKFHKEQKGMVVVEAVLSFTVFLMVVIAIIYLINIFVVHNKIQFAINSAAHELASYSYVYQALGVRGAEQTLDADGEAYTQPIDDTATQVVDSLNKIQTVYQDGKDTKDTLENMEVSKDSITNAYDQAKKTYADGTEAVDSVKESATQVTNLFSDPQSLLVGMIYMGASAGRYALKSAGATMAAKTVTQKYLGDNADTYLQGYGIKNGYSGLDFSGSTMFCDENESLIDIVVQYDVDLKFIGLVLPEDSLHVVQRVTVPAWLDGDGKTYEP